MQRSLQFLPEPSHRAIEMVKVETFDTGDVVVRHPRRAVPIRPRNEKPVQSTDEHGALDRKLEGAMLQQFTKHVGDAEPFPDFDRTVTVRRCVWRRPITIRRCLHRAS